MATALTAWLLIMALAMSLILPVIVVLMIQKRGRGQAPQVKAKRKHEALFTDPYLARLEDQGAVWPEDENDLPADLADVLAEGKKVKRGKYE